MIRKFFLILIFISLAGGQILRVEVGNNIAISALDATLFAFSLYALLSLLREKKATVLMKMALFKPIVFFLLLCVISLVVNIFHYTASELIVSFLYTIRLVSYLIVLGYLHLLGNNVKRLLKRGMLFTGGFMLLVGYVQYFFYPYLGNLYYLGWDDHLGRMFSVFLDPNFAGGFFVLFAVFIMFLFRSASNKKKKAFLMTLLLLSIFAVFLTYSRSAFLVLLVAATLFGWRFFPKKLLFGTLVMFVVIFLGLANFSIEGKNPFRVVSTSERVKSMQNALFLIQKQPLFGVGFNAYRYAQLQYGLRLPGESIPSHADAGTDNSYLFVLSTAGIFGFAGFLYLIGNILKKSYSLRKKGKYGACVFIMVVVLLSDSFFVNALFYPMLLFWVILSSVVIEQELQ